MLAGPCQRVDRMPQDMSGARARMPPMTYTHLQRVSHLLLAVTVCFNWCGRLAVAQRDYNPSTAGNACQPVLAAGVAGTIAATGAGVTYSAVHQAACLDYSSYVFADYQDDNSNLSGPSGAAAALNLAAKALDWGGSAVSSSTGTFWQLTEVQFNDALSKAAAYRATSCGDTAISSASNASVRFLSTFLNPNVSSAYVSCLNLHNAGIKVSQTQGFGSKSATAEFKYVPLDSSKAYLTGLEMTPAAAANCLIFQSDMSMQADPNDSRIFSMELSNYKTYSITCQLDTSLTFDSIFTEIRIFTNVQDDPFRLLLVNR